MRTQAEIEDQVDAARAAIPQSRPTQRDYYQGVRDALGWVLEKLDHPPVNVERLDPEP